MTSAFLSLLADHAVLVCVGLFAAAALAWPARALLKRDPQSCYQLLLALLVGAVAVLPIQLLVQGRGAPLAAPARDWFRSLLRPAVERQEAPESLRRSGPPAQEVPFKTFLVDAAPPAATLPTELRVAATLAAPASALAPGRDAPPECTSAVATVAGASPAAAAPPLVATWASRTRELGRSLARLARPIGWERAFAGLWLAGVAFIASRRTLRALRTRRMLARAQAVADPAILSLWRRVASGSRIATRVRLVASTAVESPACTGLLSRVLILPARPVRPLAPDVLEWALRHELVHLERGDQWAALFQSVVTALLWFHPAAWWLSAEIGRLRELSCDQRVVESSGRRKSYALALLECAASVSNPITAIDADPHSAGVRCALLHWSRSPTQIRRRIEMLTVESQSLPRTRKVLGILLAGCALAVPAIAQVAGAATLLPARQAAPQPPAAPVVPAAPAASMTTQDDGATAVPAPVAKKKKRHVVAPAGATAPTPVPPPSAPRIAALGYVDGDTPPVGAPCVPCTPTPVQAPCPPACPPGVDLVPCVGVVDVDGDSIADLTIADGDSDCCAVGVGNAYDDGAEQYSAAVRAQVRAAQRQIEAALKQVQRGQASQQATLKRQIEQLQKQEQRVRSQQERKRSAIDGRIANSDDEAIRDELQKQREELEAAAERETTECSRRCEELEEKLAELDQTDLSDCYESLGDYQQSMDGQVDELKETIRAAANQAMRQAQRAGPADTTAGSDDGDERPTAAKVRAIDAERLAKKAQIAAQQARAGLEQSLARAGQTGAMNAATQRQLAEALARVEEVDAAQVKQAVERAAMAAQRASTARRPGVASGATARSRPAPKADAAPARDPVASDLGEARLLEKISVLEAEVDSLRAELARLHAQPASPPPAKRARAMR